MFRYQLGSGREVEVAILITGALGVIGRRLTQHLRSHGHDVRATDVTIRTEEHYRRADVTRYEELAEVFRLWPITDVFHLAGEVGRENGEQLPRRCVDINVSGTLKSCPAVSGEQCPPVFRVNERNPW